MIKMHYCRWNLIKSDRDDEEAFNSLMPNLKTIMGGDVF